MAVGDKVAVKDCSCKHEQQDRLYGKGKRVMNAVSKPKGLQDLWRCTVCSAERGD